MPMTTARAAPNVSSRSTHVPYNPPATYPTAAPTSAPSTAPFVAARYPLGARPAVSALRPIGEELTDTWQLAYPEHPPKSPGEAPLLQDHQVVAMDDLVGQVGRQVGGAPAGPLLDPPGGVAHQSFANTRPEVSMTSTASSTSKDPSTSTTPAGRRERLPFTGAARAPSCTRPLFSVQKLPPRSPWPIAMGAIITNQFLGPSLLLSCSLRLGLSLALHTMLAGTEPLGAPELPDLC